MGYEINRPWTEPGYTGRLKQTFSINPSDCPPPAIDEIIGLTLGLLIEEKITDEQAKRLLTHYDKLKQEGNWNCP